MLPFRVYREQNPAPPQSPSRQRSGSAQCCAAHLVFSRPTTSDLAGSVCNPRRINTCKSATKQRLLTLFGMNTCRKPRGPANAQKENNTNPKQSDEQTLRRGAALLRHIPARSIHNATRQKSRASHEAQHIAINALRPANPQNSPLHSRDKSSASPSHNRPPSRRKCSVQMSAGCDRKGETSSTAPAP